MLPIWHFETRGDKCSWKARPLSRQTVKEPRWGPMHLTHRVSYGVGGGAPVLPCWPRNCLQRTRPGPAQHLTGPTLQPHHGPVQCGQRGVRVSRKQPEWGASDSMAPASSPFSSLTRARDPRELRKQDACRMVGVKESKTPSCRRTRWPVRVPLAFPAI